MVGNVEGIEVTNFNLDYTSNPTLTLNRNVLVRNVSGSFTVGDALVSHTGTVVSFDSRNILQLKTSVTLNEGDVITTSMKSQLLQYINQHHLLLMRLLVL